MSEMTENTENGDEKVDPQAEAQVEQPEEAEETAEPEVLEAKEEGQDEAPQEDDYKQKYFYLAAEMENMRKRFEREKNNWIKFGNEKILNSLLEVVDNLDRTMGAVSDEDRSENEKVKGIMDGIEMVRNQFLEILKKSGLEAVEALGKEFDPNFHEAMAQQEVEGKKEGEIIMEYQKGYVLNGRLLRPAKVIVAKEKK